MSAIQAWVAGIATAPVVILLAVVLDLILNLTGSRSRSECQWCDWVMTERRGRAHWLVKARFRVHRDMNHRAEYLDWRANR